MNRYKCLLACLCAGIMHFIATGQPVKTDASLESVTVFNAGAELNHKAKASLRAGSNFLIINKVARNLDEKSIRIGADANITILSVSFNRNYLDEAKENPAITGLKDSLKAISKRSSKIVNEKEAEKKVLALLEKNSAIGGSQQGVSVAELMKMADYYKEKSVSVQNHIDELEEQEALLDNLTGKLESQVEELENDRSSTTGQLVVQVMAGKAATTGFHISYISPDAGWVAFYDLRAASASDPLSLSYKAKVVQHTGIDWKQVKLQLATGNPSQGGTAPQLTAWFLRFMTTEIYKEGYASIEKRPITNVIKALDGAAGIQMTSGGGQPGDDPMTMMRGQGSLSASSSPLLVVDGAVYEGSYSSIDPSSIATISILKDATAASLYGARGTDGVILITTKNKTLSSYTTTAENVLNTTFDIDLPYDIASNDQPHSVSLKEYSIPAHYSYTAVPGADQDAFLMAGITGYEQLGLLPGEATLTFENMYVGRSFINPGITDDTLKLSMGRDKKIIVKREKIADMNANRFIGNSRKQTFTYEIQVRNTKKDAVALQLNDQYPMSTDKDIEIELLESDHAEVNKTTGILTWKLALAPGETKKVRISYSVKYPKDRRLDI